MGYEKFHAFLDIINSLRDQGFDVPIAVTGDERMGKSTFAIQSCIRLLPLTGPEKFDLETNVAYTNAEVIKKMQLLTMKGVLTLDEAMRVAYNLKFSTGESKDLKEMFTQVGFKKMVYFFNIPNFWMLDPFYRNHRVKFWIHVVDRGRAILFQPNRQAYQDDPWARKDAIKSIGKKFISLTDSVEKKIGIYQRLPCYVDTLAFPQLPRDLEEKYEALSFTRKMERPKLEKEEGKLATKHRLALTKAASILLQKGMSIPELSSSIGVEPSNVYHWLDMSRLDLKGKPLPEKK